MSSKSEQALLELPISVLDFETTGLSATDRVVQASVVQFRGMDPPQLVFGGLVNPEQSIDPRATAVHGISDQDVATAPTFGEIAPALIDSIEGRVFASYNAAFDLRFLRFELRRLGFDFETSFICVMELRQLIFAERRCKLTKACAEMGIGLNHGHQATTDALAAGYLLQRYFDLLYSEGVYSIKSLSEFGNRAFLRSFSSAAFRPVTATSVSVARHGIQSDYQQLEQECSRLTTLAERKLRQFESILVNGLKSEISVKWDRLKVSLEARQAAPEKPTPKLPDKPNLALKPDRNAKPSLSDSKYQINETVVDSFLPWNLAKKEEEMKKQFESDLADFKRSVEEWNQLVSAYNRQKEQAKNSYNQDLMDYRTELKQYEARLKDERIRIIEHNAEIERERAGYDSGNPEFVEKAMTRVFMNSNLPEEFPDVVDVTFDGEQSKLTVIRQIVSIDALPTIKAYRLIKKDYALREQQFSDAARKRLFDSIVYQMALRTIFECFKGDEKKHIETVEVKCVVDGYDPANGHPGQLVLARITVQRDRFLRIHLKNVDPIECFKDLGGKTRGRPCNHKPLETIF